MPRIANLTGLRAFAALWVVLYHVSISNSTMHGRLGRVIGHGAFGVDVFFVLSGFVLALVYADKLPHRWQWSWYRKFLGRRFAKVYPFHLITLIAMVAVIELAARMHYNFTAASENTGWTALCSALLVHSLGVTQALSWNVPSWSVSAEWIAYAVLFAPIVFCLRGVKTLYVALIAAVLLALASAAPFVFHKAWTHLTYQGVVRIVPEFMCGYLLYRMLRGRRQSARNGWAIAGGGALLASCYLRGEYPWLLIPSIMMLLAGLVQDGRIAKALFANRAAVLLGEASYSIYLIQTFVIIVANQVVRRIHLPDSTAALFAVALVETAVCAGLGVVVFLKIEEPLRQWTLRRLGTPRRSEEATVRTPEIPGTQADTQVASTVG